MRDEEFIRGAVPMTKSEVRAVSISKLELEEDSVVYDVGAGTGSVSVEAAGAVRKGRVFAIEKKKEAVELLYANKNRFSRNNMTVIEGTAPAALKELPAPTHVFLGGTSGSMDGILEAVLEKNPKARVVINVISLESLAEAVSCLKKRDIEGEIVSIQVSKARKAGAYHLMEGQNPVYVISFGGEKKEEIS